MQSAELLRNRFNKGIQRNIVDVQNSPAACKTVRSKVFANGHRAALPGCGANHYRARAGKGYRNRAANSAGRARHQCNLSSQRVNHTAISIQKYKKMVKILPIGFILLEKHFLMLRLAPGDAPFYRQSPPFNVKGCQNSLKIIENVYSRAIEEPSQGSRSIAGAARP